jgi:hypothetical protein
MVVTNNLHFLSGIVKRKVEKGRGKSEKRKVKSEK